MKTTKVEVPALFTQAANHKINCPVCDETYTQMTGFTHVGDLRINYECTDGHRWELVFESFQWKEYISCEIEGDPARSKPIRLRKKQICIFELTRSQLADVRDICRKYLDRLLSGEFHCTREQLLIVRDAQQLLRELPNERFAGEIVMTIFEAGSVLSLMRSICAAYCDLPSAPSDDDPFDDSEHLDRQEKAKQILEHTQVIWDELRKLDDAENAPAPAMEAPAPA